MSKLETILDFSHGSWGEDRIFAGEKLCFVIDGATPISGAPFGAYHTGAEWMAEELSRYLAEHDGEIPALCKQFTEQTQCLLQEEFRDVHSMPCAVLSAVRWEKAHIQGYVLGDCAVYVLHNSGEIACYADRRTATFYKKTLQAKANAAKAGMDVEEAVRDQRKKNKAAMNQPGGYWTVSYIGDFEREFCTFRIPAEEIQGILLCSDGFDRIFERNLFTPEDILRGKISLNAALSKLRAAEKVSSADVKVHDDASAILLRP